MRVPMKMRAYRPVGGEPICRNCRFNFSTGAHVSECRRRAPAFAQDRAMGVWPLVVEDMTCGDFDVRLVRVED